MTFQIKELLLDDGMSPFGQWFKGLEGVAAAKVQVAVTRMEQGNLSNVVWFRSIDLAVERWDDYKRRKAAKG